MQRMKCEKIVYSVMKPTETGAEKIGEYIHDKVDEKTGQVKELKSKSAIKAAILSVTGGTKVDKEFLVIADTETHLYELGDLDFWASATRVHDKKVEV